VGAGPLGTPLKSAVVYDRFIGGCIATTSSSREERNQFIASETETTEAVTSVSPTLCELPSKDKAVH